tara:strand:- start:766 stop:1164 length:399 start_codon:yes stop_codon:yes gene_type:complete
MHKKILSILFTSLLVGLVLADDSKEVYPFEDVVQEERFLSLLNELRCPKCQGSNLSGSNAPIAIDLKREVYRLVKLGKTEKEVKNYLVDRYGNFIVYDPPFETDTYALWLAPLLLFLVAMSVILFRRFSDKQ